MANSDYIGNIRGPIGATGPQGLPGTNATPADTAVAGYISTAGTSDTQVAADNRYAKKTSAPMNVLDFGAEGDGVTDDTAAVQAAITAMGSASGHLFFPPGDYIMSPLTLSMKANLTLSGQASMVDGIYTNSSGAAASRILFSGVTTGSCITVDGGYGFGARDLAIVATNASFTGRLLDMRQVAAATVTGLVTLERCFIGGNSASRYGIGVDLDKNVISQISRCTITDFQYGVQGLATAGSFSNAVTIEDTLFQNNRTAHIHNPGESWLLKNNTYEALSNGQAGSILQDSGFTCEALTVEGGWLGDVTSVTPSIHFNFLGTAYGVAIHGVFLGGTTNATGAYFTAGSGISISGNSFHGLGTAVSASAVVKGHVGPNAYVAMSGINVTATGMTVTDAASSAYTPAWTSAGTAPAIGNGSLAGKWKRTPGNMIDGEIAITTGSTTTYGTGIYSLSLPATPAAAQVVIGEVYALNSGVGFQAGAVVVSGSTATVYFHGSGNTWGATGPWTFKNGDYVKIRFRYEAA